MVSKEFEQQFSHRERITTPMGTVEAVDMNPFQPVTSIPILFAPGWRETPELQMGCLREVYDAQRRVLTLVHPSRIQRVEQERGDLPAVEVQKAKTLLALLEEKRISQTDVITHSEGAINVAIAATMDPDKFRNLVLVAPAGLIGKDSLIRVSMGFLRHLLQSSQTGSLFAHQLKRRGERDSNLFESLSYAVKEGNAITSFDIHQLLMDLRKQGVKIAVLFGEKDTVFPFEKVKAHLAKSAEASDFGFDIFATKPGGHEIYSKPKEVMSQVLDLLTQLEGK